MTVKRIRFVQELLTFVGIGERVHLEWISSAEAQKFAQVVTEFTEKIRALGPNPIRKAGNAVTPVDWTETPGPGIQPGGFRR